MLPLKKCFFSKNEFGWCCAYMFALVPMEKGFAWREACRKYAAGTLKIQDVQTLFHFTEKSTGLGLAACTAGPSSQPNLWCYRNLCHLSSENDLNQSINKQAALYFWNSERENVRPHTHTHTHTHTPLCMWIIYNNSGLFRSVVIVYNLSYEQEWSPLEINQSRK